MSDVDSIFSGEDIRRKVAFSLGEEEESLYECQICHQTRVFKPLIENTKQLAKKLFLNGDPQVMCFDSLDDLLSEIDKIHEEYKKCKCN